MTHSAVVVTHTAVAKSGVRSRRDASGPRGARRRAAMTGRAGIPAPEALVTSPTGRLASHILERAVQLTGTEEGLASAVTQPGLLTLADAGREVRLRRRRL
jgi:hypothetical protein